MTWPGISLRGPSAAAPQGLEHLSLEISDGLLVPRTERPWYVGAGRVIALRVLADPEVLAHDAAIGRDGLGPRGGRRLRGVGEVEVVNELGFAGAGRIDTAGVHAAG